jgi:probable rRNA maturation factor
MPRKLHSIEIQYGTGRRAVPSVVSLRQWARAALEKDGRTLCIRLVGKAESRLLNKKWRGKDKPTNVLSFPLALARQEARVTSHDPLGDIAICAPVVAQEAREQGKPLRVHWAHIVVHGVLHLQGFDHVKDRDAKRMEAREIEILSRFGYPNPYL